MTYAFSLFNGVMHLGQNALGSSAGFKGNGMCFSTRGLRRRPWQCYGLVEDMEYSWTLRVAGEKIGFQPDASVYGAMLGVGRSGGGRISAVAGSSAAARSGKNTSALCCDQTDLAWREKMCRPAN